jgi:hypothetical protein
MQENTALGAIAVVPGAGGTVTVKYGLDDYQSPDASAQFDAVLESNAGVLARGTVAVASAQTRLIPLVPAKGRSKRPFVFVLAYGPCGRGFRLWRSLCEGLSALASCFAIHRDVVNAADPPGAGAALAPASMQSQPRQKP